MKETKTLCDKCRAMIEGNPITVSCNLQIRCVDKNPRPKDSMVWDEDKKIDFCSLPHMKEYLQDMIANITRKLENGVGNIDD